eukprot:5798627-Prymnesium_polylepis.1
MKLRRRGARRRAALRLGRGHGAVRAHKGVYPDALFAKGNTHTSWSSRCTACGAGSRRVPWPT